MIEFAFELFLSLLFVAFVILLGIVVYRFIVWIIDVLLYLVGKE